MNKELPNQNINEEIESFQDDRSIDYELANKKQLEREKKEQEFEIELSKQTIKDQRDIDRLTEEATKAANIETGLKTDTTGHEELTKEKGTQKKIGGLRKLAMALGFTMAGLAGNAAASPVENSSDSTKEKITQVENRQEVAGITLEGMVSVPMADTTADYYFLGFSGNEKDKNKIEKMKEAVEKMGYELADANELTLALKKHGKNLIDATGGYGISLKNVDVKADDTKNPIINNVVQGPKTHTITTFNPLGKTGKYEIEAMEKTGFRYDQYPVFVKKNKADKETANYLDFANKK